MRGQDNLFDTNISGAEFSKDRKYRYALWRVWNDELPRILFIGLNPSTANETQNDPTIRRVIGFANSWGYGGIYMMNLFAIVSTDPSILKSHSNPVGNNDYWLEKLSLECKDILFAWGNFKGAEKRAREVMKMFPFAYCLGVNQNGSPKHPLYIKADTKPILFKTK